MSSLVLETLGAARDLGRLHEIASVLVRHGMSDLVRRTGIAGLLERAGSILHVESAQHFSDKSRERHVREALEELGPTFVKVGQIMAGRRDLLPPSLTEELSLLNESANEVPLEEIRTQLLEDLGAPPEEVFRDFRAEPLAAASIAQVHRARLQSGEDVVLKVRRPGIREVVEADIRLLTRLAELAERELPELERYRPVNLVRQATRSLRRELDLRNEARNAADLRSFCDTVVIPAVYDRWSSERLCVMELLDGPSMGEWLDSGEAPREAREQVARIGADAVLEMVFEHGFFHADPHPGNVLVLSDNRVGLVDFGMIGTLTEDRRLEFLGLLGAVSEQDVDGVVDILLDWSHDGRSDQGQLREDTSAFVQRYRDVPIGDLDTGALLADINSLLRDNDLFLPNDVALLLKVFVTLEAMGKALDPEFVMSKHVEPFARRAMSQLRSPVAILRRSSKRMSRVLWRLPKDLDRILERLRRGSVGVDVEVPQLVRFGDVIDKSANRITIGLVTSALIVGTAICTTASEDPFLVWIGFAGAVLAGSWLILSILRSGS